MFSRCWDTSVGNEVIMGVVISPNMKRTKEMIDPMGNIIDPETKTVLELNTPGYVPTKEEVEAKINVPVEPTSPPVNFQPTDTKLTIQQQIEQAEQHLVALKLQKKDQIHKMKEELAKLEENV